MIKAGNTNTATVIQVTYALRPHGSAKWPQHSNTPGDTSDREKINTCVQTTRQNTCEPIKKKKKVRNDLRQFTPYLRHTEHKGQAPCNHNGSVPAGGCTSPIRLQGAADGIVPIHSHGNNHVGGCKHPYNLQILDGATQSVRALEVLCDVPHQLWQHLGTK